MPQGGRFCASCGAFNDPNAVQPPPAPPVAPPIQYYPTYPQSSFVPVKPQRTFKQKVGIAIGVLLLACVGLSMLGNATKGSASTTGTTSSSSSSYSAPSYSGASMIDPRLIASSPSSYKGTNLYIQGEALNVSQYSDYTWVQVMARIPGKDYDTESIIVEVRPKVTVLKGDCYKFYAVGQGTQKVTRTLTGASNEVPLLGGYLVEEASADKYGTCLAPR